MEDTTNSTRVSAPARTSHSNPLVKGAATQSLKPNTRMKRTTQSSIRDGVRLNTTKVAVEPKKLFRVATWNVLTLARKGYVESIIREMSKYNISMAGFTESRIPGSDLTIYDGATLLHSGAATRCQGVALMLRHPFDKSLMTWKAISPRLLSARIRHRHGAFTVLVVYAPTEQADDNTKDEFYDRLCGAVRDASPHDDLIILGDLNASTGTEHGQFPDVVGKFGSGNLNDNSLRLLTFCGTHGLSALGSWFRRKNIWRWTWISNDGHTKKEIDHILTSRRSLFQSYRTYRGAEAPANTDHRLVVAEMKLHPWIKRKSKARPRLDLEKLRMDSQLAEKYCCALLTKQLNVADLKDDDVEQAWQKVSSALSTAASETIGYARTKRKPWLSDATLSIVDLKAKARLEGNMTERRRLCSVFRARAKQDREEWYNRLADEAEGAMHGNNLRVAYRTIRELSGKKVASTQSSICKSNGEMCLYGEETCKRWCEHYDLMLNHPSASMCTELDRQAAEAVPDDSINLEPPSPSEVYAAVKKLRNCRAAGPDDIAPELLKCAPQPAISTLHALFLKVWEEGRVPVAWKNGTIVSLYKGKGPKTSCSSHRPITLLSVPGKVFAHVILARIKPLLCGHRRPQQSGFTSSRGTADAVLALRLLAEIHWEFRQPLNVAYIDLKAAFDSVDRSAMCKTLLGVGLPTAVVDIIRDLHTHTTSRVRVGAELSEEINTTSGVRQGCVLAPDLFCRVFDCLMEMVSTDFGIHIGEVKFTDLDYADDGVLFLGDQTDALSLLLQNFNNKAGHFGLHVSWDKTKIQNLGHGPPPSTFHVEASVVESVEHFIYLGSKMCSNGHCTPEVLRRIALAAGAMNSLGRVWRQKRLHLNTKLKIYETCVVSILLYCSETWTLLKSDSDRLQAFHMRCLRQIVGVAWYDHVTNDAVKEMTGLIDIDIRIKRRRMALFGHVARLQPGVPARDALQLSIAIHNGSTPNPGWRRPRGRPRKTWLDQIKVDIGTMNLSEAWSLASMRTEWRSFATSRSRSSV